MTSATANGSKTKESKAFRDLQFATGEKRIALSELHPEELRALLIKELGGLDMKELRGFRELKETLSRRGDEPLQVSDAPAFVCHGSPDEPFTLKSHTIRVCRGVLSQKQTYRRHETDAETDDWETARGWGRSGYLYRGQESLLLMRRLPDYWDTNGLLVEVAYNYIKIPNEKEYVINEISARPIPISAFCKHFGKEAPAVARNLLWELSSIYRLTADEMENKARQIRQATVKRERLADSIG